MARVTLFHNPRCSKSRAARELLEARGVDLDIVEYLVTPPDAATLRDLVLRLGVGARALLRTGESDYRELGLDNPSLTDAALLEAIAAHPRLLERPIAVRGDRAVIGRPPERVLELL
jgi:arsenate reductase